MIDRLALLAIVVSGVSAARWSADGLRLHLLVVFVSSALAALLLGRFHGPTDGSPAAANGRLEPRSIIRAAALLSIVAAMSLIVVAHAIAPLLVPLTIVAIAGITFFTLGAAGRSGANLGEVLPAAVYVSCAEAAVWPFAFGRFPKLHVLLLAVGLMGLLLDVVRAKPAAVGREVRAWRAFPWLAVALAASLLLRDLGSYSGILVTWETPVTEGFGEAFRAGIGPFQYFARHLLWDDGLVSAGHTSLFYGVPTHALFHVAGFSTWTLRICSVIAALGAIGAIGWLGRRFFSAEVGATAACALMLAPPTLFYGRYGTSLAGTVLAVLVALHATWAFLERSTWWRGAICAVALYVTTLQYSPARILVLLLLGWIALISLLEWRRFDRGRFFGVAIVFASAALVWWVQGHFGTRDLFLNARGEQFFEFARNPRSIEGLFGKPLLGRSGITAFAPVHPLELVDKILEVTVPQYVERLAPASAPPRGGSLIGMDPPPLPFYFAPLGAFIVWGLAVSVCRFRSAPHAFLIVWLVLGSIPILLTNRVDAHRLVVFVVPIAIWTAIGLVEAARRMRAAGVPSWARVASGVLLGATALAADLNLLTYDERPRPLIAERLAAEIETVPGPVVVAAVGDHRDLSSLRPRLLERMRKDPRRTFTMLPTERVEALRGPRDPAAARDFERAIAGGTGLAAPAQAFRGLERSLLEHGFRVARRERRGGLMLRVDEGVAVTGMPDEELRPLATRVPLPTPTPLPVHFGERRPLTALPPLANEAGFVPAQLDRGWDGGRLVMSGIPYARGIGAHAWSKITYAVPERAIALEATIGLADDAQSCSRASVTFEVRDESGGLLFDSGLVDETIPARRIRVELGGARTMSLVVTEAGDGRDCDHAIWAEPELLVR